MDKEYNLNIDLIRIIATLMVVTAHVIRLIDERPDFFGSKYWWLIHILITICRMGTPLFFMISGYLVAFKTKSYKEVLNSTGKRLIVPLISFSLIQWLAFAWIHGQKLSFNWQDIFVGGNSSLYFLYGLIMLQLMTPLLKVMLNGLNQNQFEWLVGGLIVNTGLFTLGDYLLSSTGNLTYSIFEYWFLVLGFYSWGVYFQKFQLQQKASLVWMNLLLVGAILAYIFQAKYYSTNDLFWFKLANYSQNYLGVIISIPSIILFKYLMKLNISSIKQWGNLWIKSSYGIYLIHLIILEYLLVRSPLTVDLGFAKPQVMILLIWISTMGFSLLAASVIRRIKYLRAIVGES